MRQFTFPLSFGLSVCLLVASELPGARAEDKKQKSERARFETVDQVTLHGTFWPGSKGRKSPCVILLHKLGGKGSHEEGWDLLAEELAKKGFAVLSFDFRGHGGSTSIGDEFWKYRFNRDLVKNYKIGVGAKQPEAITVGDFKPAYWPFLVNDISAARSFLERKNDGGECNISNLILIGAEDGATLGALWLASESRRYRLLPPPAPAARPRLNSKPEGKDVIACVWLSLSTTIGPDRAKTQVANPLRGWLQDAGAIQKIPMAFFYGKEDTDSSRLAQSWLQIVKPNKQPMETVTRAIEGAGKVRGSPLLKVKEDEGTVALLLAENYLSRTILDKYGSSEWEKRETERHPYVWAFRGQQITAKNFDEKAFHPIPLPQFGFR